VLKEHLKEMKLAVEAAHIRTQVALVMPNLFKLPEGEDPLDPKVMQRRLEKKLRKARKRNSVRILGAKGG
jgi:hypothetical protein